MTPGIAHQAALAKRAARTCQHHIDQLRIYLRACPLDTRLANLSVQLAAVIDETDRAVAAMEVPTQMEAP